MTGPIAADLEAVYRATIVTIPGDDPIVVSMADPIGTHDRWLAEQGSMSAAIITAWNPFSHAQPRTLNEAYNAALHSAIEQAQRRWVPARGSDPSGAWFEVGFCVFDVPDVLLKAWLVTFEQTAAFRLGMGAQVELVWHERFGHTSQSTGPHTALQAKVSVTAP